MYDHNFINVDKWARVSVFGPACPFGFSNKYSFIHSCIFISLCHRWGFVTHGCIDGYSRTVTFLQTGTSNEAKVVLNLFAQAVHKFGLPSRVRCDHGGENIDIALFMTLMRGSGRGSAIAGKSVHNQRIERLWRDVYTQIAEKYYKLFYEMEDERLLDVDSNIQLFALQTVFLPEINRSMNEFRSAWNSHRLRTARNQSPQQLWLNGMLQHANSSYVATTEIFSNPPSVTVRLEEALANLNIDPQNILHNPGIDVPQALVVVDPVVMADIQQSIANISDAKDRYNVVVQMLSDV